MDKIKNNKNILIFIAIIFLVGVIIGYYLSINIRNSNFSPISKTSKSCQAMLKEVFSNTPVTNFFGQVTSVSPTTNSLTVKVGNIYGFNLPEKYQTKKILINKNTVITLRINKSPKVFEKEMAKYEKKQSKHQNNLPTSTLDNSLNPPLPYLERKVDIRAIKSGDKIMVGLSPKNGQAISFLDSQFNAAEIVIIKDSKN